MRYFRTESGPGVQPKMRWRQFLAIGDDYVGIVHMEPGYVWKVRRTTTQSNDDWCGMKTDEIVNWKKKNDDDFVTTIEITDPDVIARIKEALDEPKP